MRPKIKIKYQEEALFKQKTLFDGEIEKNQREASEEKQRMARELERTTETYNREMERLRTNFSYTRTI